VVAGSEKSGAGWPNRRPVMASQYILSRTRHCEPQDVVGQGPRRPRRA